MGTAASEHMLRPGAPCPAGRNIGLCNRKLRAMSGEEVESMEQNKLADHVGKVGASQGLAGAGWMEGVSNFAFTDSALPHAFVSRCLSSSGPARSTSSKS